MTQNNSSNGLLNIDFNLKKGLILKWNFTGELSKDNYYRHLLIIDTENLTKTQSFLKLYYKKIRIGDLFGIKRTHKYKSSKSLKWKEKNLIDIPNFESFHFTPFTEEELKEELYEVAEFNENDEAHWPLIVSILTDKHSQERILGMIEGVRKEMSSLNFIVNVFGEFKNRINFRSGVNFFDFDLGNREDVLDFYKNYINRIEFYYVEIHIECENGIIACQENSEWPNTALNTISKRFYGPHKDYQSDILFFLNSESYGELDLLLHISIEYITLEGRKYQSSKRMSLKSFDNSLQSRTLGFYGNLYDIEIHRNVWFEKYPFKSEYFVWFNKDKDNGLKQSLKNEQDIY